MTARQLPEETVDLVITHIRNNIDVALQDIRTDRSDPRISTEKPVSYYISERVRMALNTPAVFVICDSIDFQKEIKGANHVNAKVFLNISLICEDKDTEILTRRCYRYLGALHSILDQTNLSNSKARMSVIVERSDFSSLFVPETEKGVFRKEVVLNCTVYVYENF